MADQRQLSRQSLTTRYLTLFGGEAFGKACTLVAFAYIARTVTPADFGRIELSLTVTLFFVLGVDCGVGSYAARIIAAEPWRTGQLLARVILLRAVLAVPAYLIILTLSARYGMPGLGILAVYGLTVLFIPLHNQWVFQGLGRMRWVAVGNALRYLIFAATVLMLLRRNSDPRLVPIAEVMGAAGLAAFNFLGRFVRIGARLDWEGALRGAVTLFREAWPLAASQIAFVSLWYFPEVVLGLRARPSQLALLAASLRIVLAIHTFVSLYFFNLLPGLPAAFARSATAGRDLANRSLKTSMWVGCLLAGSITLLAPNIVVMIYGEAYRASGVLLQIAIWMIPIGWLAGHFRYTLIATGNHRPDFVNAILTAVVTVALALALVGRSEQGGIDALAALLTGGVVSALLGGIAVANRVGRLQVGRALSSPAVAVAGSLVLGSALTHLTGSVAAAALAFGVYAAVAVRRDSRLSRLGREWLRI